MPQRLHKDREKRGPEESVEKVGERSIPDAEMTCDRFENRSVTLFHRTLATSAGTKPSLVTLAWLGISLIVVAACTWLAFHFQLNLATMGFLYLILVIAAAMRGGFWLATIMSVVSALCLNYFFAPPVFSFRINDPANWFALCAFELTALVISRLSDRANDRTVEAVREQRYAERLYQVSLRMFQLNRSQDPGGILASVIHEAFDLQAVVLFDSVSGNAYSAGDASPLAEERARRAYLCDSSEFDPVLQSWFCVLRVNLRPAGGLALCGSPLPPLIANALASLCAISLERFRSLERECRAEAVRQTEQLRTAVLDSLAHQIKTPVATIWAASSGLLTLGGLSETQEMLMNLLDEQSRKLSDLASQLICTAKLDTSTIVPRREFLMLSDVVDETVQPLDGQTRLRISYPAEEPQVFADRKLLSDALGQIVNNAFKYSTVDTPIDIQVSLSEQNATISVRNEGPVIAASDRRRIFEQFYRANPSGRGPSGSGLGLSIVRRIVEAHEGRVWVESQAGLTVFSIALPLASRAAEAPQLSGLDRDDIITNAG
jgi:two-component system, OmpR family, sensor histidine kinase KdpD